MTVTSGFTFIDGEAFYFIGPYMVPYRRGPLISVIQGVVADYYHIPLGEMRSARRTREVARPRQVAMYLSKRLTSQSLPEIGRRFGGRDHTTVIHALRQIERLKALDSELALDIRTLSDALA